jgi:hypothetical protein
MATVLAPRCAGRSTGTPKPTTAAGLDLARHGRGGGARAGRAADDGSQAVGTGRLPGAATRRQPAAIARPIPLAAPVTWARLPIIPCGIGASTVLRWDSGADAGFDSDICRNLVVS